MKRFLFFLCALQALFCGIAAADYNDETVLEIRGVAAPYEKDGTVVFTADAKSRFTGIAFDFEGYKTIHPFRIHTMRDMDGTAKGSVLFYILHRPEKAKSLSYRLVIDGLWTTDPANPDSYYDEKEGISLSRFTFASDLPQKTAPDATNASSHNIVHFICRAGTRQKIYLAGSFTNWDPWIYEMKETSRGVYEIALPLPSGTHYYNYYSGMDALTDSTNPNKAYTKDGRVASVITVP